MLLGGERGSAAPRSIEVSRSHTDLGQADSNFGGRGIDRDPESGHQDHPSIFQHGGLPLGRRLQYMLNPDSSLARGRKIHPYTK